MHALNSVIGLPESLVGGKSLRLAQMQLLGLRIKPAVVLDSAAVQSILTTGVVSNLVKEVVCKNLSSNGHGFAVRSSASGEDGDLSWAGQFKSLLFVSAKELDNAVLDCAAAIQSESVAVYAKIHGSESAQLALVIQEMVNAEMAGVLFTHNPVTLNDREMIVEVVAGVAEGLVSGQTEPHRYYIDAEDGTVLREEGVADPKLSNALIKELVTIGQILRESFGQGQDIEWAVEAGTGLLFINQSRNITTDNLACSMITLTSSLEQGLELEQDRLTNLGVSFPTDVLSDQNISEILTRYPHQMSFGLFTYLFAHGNGAIRTARNEMGYEISEELESGFFRLIAGQPRCSIVHDAFTYRVRGVPLQSYTKLVKHYLEQIHNNPNLANYPEVQLYEQNPSEEFLRAIFGAADAMTYVAAYREFFSGIQRLEDHLDQDLQSLLTKLDSDIAKVSFSETHGLTQLQDSYQQVCEMLRTRGCTMFVKAARLGFFAFARLRNLLSEMYGDQAESHLNTLTGGIDPEVNPNLQFNLDLLAMKNGTVELPDILARYGHLGAHELEIATPRYHDQPELLHELAMKLEDSYPEHLQENQARARALRQQLVNEAGYLKERLDREIEMARTYLPLREKVKFHFLKGYAVLRRIAVTIEKKLGWDKDLIFHLNPEELFRISESHSSMRELATERKKRRDSERSVEVPAVIFSNKLDEIGKGAAETPGALKGIGVTNVITEGTVVVVTMMTDSETMSLLKPGSILVTSTTDPAWSPVLASILPDGGLVTEVGGLLAHGAIYAREMNIAAVLNVPNATKLLKTGMRVRINGRAGTVELL